MSNVLPLYRTAAPPAVEAPYPTSCARTITFGLVVIALAFGGFGGWAGLAPLSSAAIAPGTVVVDSSRKSVQHLEGGVIREILVRDGDLVEAGQVLVRLDGAGVRAAIASLQPMLATNQAQRARLQAERQGLAEIRFPDDLLADAAATTPQILAGQQRVFETRRNALEGEKALNLNRLAQSRQRLEGLERQRHIKQAEIALLRDEVANLDILLSQGYATRKAVSAATEISSSCKASIPTSIPKPTRPGCWSSAMSLKVFRSIATSASKSRMNYMRSKRNTISFWNG